MMLHRCTSRSSESVISSCSTAVLALLTQPCDYTIHCMRYYYTGCTEGLADASSRLLYQLARHSSVSAAYWTDVPSVFGFVQLINYYPFVQIPWRSEQESMRRRRAAASTRWAYTLQHMNTIHNAFTQRNHIHKFAI
jgi:hypothetical protein